MREIIFDLIQNQEDLIEQNEVIKSPCDANWKEGENQRFRKMSIEAIDVDDNATLLNKIRLTPEAKSEIYRRYLKNLNYSRNGNESAHAYAELLLFKPENFSSFDVDMEITTTSDYVPRDVPFVMTHSNIINILLIVIYAIIFVLGVLGNVVTCIVIAKNRSMHTAVNFYLFSLAVSDLLLLVTGKFCHY